MATWIGATSNYNTSSNWSGGDTPDAPGEVAIFDATGSTTVTVNAAVNPDSWTFTNAARSFAIGGTAITLNSGLINNSAVAQSIANVIGGPGGLQQNGSGTLTLSGTNTYTGATHIDVGTLRAGNWNVISSAVTVATGATFDLNNTVQMIGSLAGAGNVTLGFGRLYTGNDNTDTTFSGVISGTNGINKVGAGTFVLSGHNTYSSNTFIDAGTLRLGISNALPVDAGALVVGSGTTFDLAGLNQSLAAVSGPGSITLGSGVLTINNNSSAFSSVFSQNLISGTGSLVKQGAGILTLLADNTYTGTTTISGGVLRLGAFSSTAGSIAGDIIDNAALEVSRSNTLILAGKISGSGVFSQNGTGFTILTGDNTYTGGTTISSGALVIGNNGTTGSIVGNIVNNGQLTFNRSDSITFDGLISGSGAMTKFGAGTLTLTANNTYSNGTVIAEGTLQLGNGGTTGSIGSSTLNDGGMLVFNHSNTYNFTTSIFGAGSVTQLGTGTTVLSGTNTYDGNTFLNAGTLDLAAAGAAGHGAIVFGAGSQTLRIESAALAGSQFSNTITAFGAGDVIDLRGLAFVSGATTSYNEASHVLTVTSGGISKALVINNPDNIAFKATGDGAGGTQVTLASDVHWIASSDIGTHPAGYTVLSTGDFNHDSTNDVLWFNASSLDVDLWKISNAHWAGSIDIGAHPAGYNLIGPGDFNHDGTPDLLWYNPSNGDVDIWKISNGQWAGSASVGLHPLGWLPLGDGDFNGDRTGDVLWYNASTNDAEIWMMQNAQWSASVDIGTHPAGWQPFASADLDRDGTSDLLWYNPTTRDVDVWKIVNGHWAGSIDIGTHPAGYAPAGVGDFNGDGTPDIAWFNATTGDVDIWLIANGHWAGSVDLGAHPTGWSPAGTGDFNHDGHLDILWRDAATNHVEAWLLSNT